MATSNTTLTKERFKKFQDRFEKKLTALLTKREFKERLKTLLTKKEFKEQLKTLLTKKEFEERLKTLLTKREFEKKIKSLPTRDEFFQAMDKMMKELKGHRDERAAMKFRFEDHEERITSLEEIHPSGQHSSA